MASKLQEWIIGIITPVAEAAVTAAIADLKADIMVAAIKAEFPLL